MTRENAKKLQSMMAKEAVTLLMLGGAEADTAEHEEAIRLIGEAWGLAEEETARQIERIGHGRQSVRMGAENMPPDEGDVPLVLTGREVIELERELFETAVRLNDRDKRQHHLCDPAGRGILSAGDKAHRFSVQADTGSPVSVRPERKESAADAFEPPAARTQGEVVCGGGAQRGRAGDGICPFHGNGEPERVSGFRA